MAAEKYLSITVDVEEWFHSNWFDVNHVINTYYHGVYPPSDVIESITKILLMFDELQVRATFFVLGNTAERYPSIIDSIKDAGHEIASHGYYHYWENSDLDLFRKNLTKFKKHIYTYPRGYRFPNYTFSSDVLEVLIDEGFLYDSSMVPSINIPGWYGDPHAPTEPHVYALDGDRGILEFPISVSPFLRLPGAGGWFLRNTSFLWTYHIIVSQLHKIGYANIYFHNWEISPNNPHHPGIPFHVFRNAGEPMMKRVRFVIRQLQKKKDLRIEPFEELLDHEINTVG